MSEIGTKQLAPADLERLIGEVFTNKAIAMLERYFCEDGKEPDFFGFLSELGNSISEWDRGRVFGSDSEIRWERDDREFHVVWIRDDENVPHEWQSKEQIEADGERKILLWGERIEGKDQWYEKQVPRILKYPVNDRGSRIYALLKEYRLKDNSTVYRFKGVKAE